MIDRRTEQLGLAFAGLCVLNGAFYPAMAKLTTEGADALFVATATTLFGGLAASCMLGARGELHHLVSRQNGPRLALIGLLGSACAYGLFFEGARRTTAIDTVVCLQSEPIYALIFSWLFLGHQLSFRRVAGVTVLAAGIVLAVGGGSFADPWGVAFLLATPVCWQVSHMVTLRGLVGVPPSVLTGARYVYGGIFLAVYWLTRGSETGLAPADSVLGRLPLLAVQGVLLSYVGTLFWYEAIARLDLTRATAIVVPSIPLLSVVASFALVGEVPNGRQWLGLILTAAGVLYFVTAPHAVEIRERIPASTAPIAVPADPTSEDSDAA